MKGIYVVWEDHCGTDDWHELENVRTEGVVVYSLGWFIKENDDAIVITHSLEGKGALGHSVILKATILKRKWIKV